MGLYSGDTDVDAPNVAGANEAGVWADAETLAIRKLINNAAKFGKKIDLQAQESRQATKMSPMILPDIQTQMRLAKN